MKKIIILFALLIWNHLLTAQIMVLPNQTATDLVNNFVATSNTLGVVISNETLTCDSVSNGLFSGISNLGISNGVVLCNGQVDSIAGAGGIMGPASVFASYSSNLVGDSDLNMLVTGTTYDACKLELDLQPVGNFIEFEYVFGSEEYTSFTCTAFNDVFGFFLSGPGISGPYSNNSKNLALVPGSSTCPVAISTIFCPNMAGCCNTTQTCFGNTSGCGMFNATNNTCAFFVCNATGQTVSYNGFTVPLTIHESVIPGQTYHLKLAIADKSDHVLDSGVFLKANSLKSGNTIATGITNYDGNNPIIYPTLFDDNVHIQASVKNNWSLTIKDHLGRFISTQTLQNSSSDHVVNTSNLNSGMYFFVLTNVENQMQTVVKAVKE